MNNSELKKRVIELKGYPFKLTDYEAASIVLKMEHNQILMCEVEGITGIEKIEAELVEIKEVFQKWNWEYCNVENSK